MTLDDLGYRNYLDKCGYVEESDKFETGRVVAVHKERYIVKNSQGEFEAEISGNFRFACRGREDFPAVGDWVCLSLFEGNLAIIHHILPRYSILTRNLAGNSGNHQVIAANVDCAFIIQAVDRDFNINRLERYLTICHSNRIQPVILLSKIDLALNSEVADMLPRIHERIREIPVIPFSNETRVGYDAIIQWIEKGKTCCLLGSSGIGKSTLLNNLCGVPLMQTDAISLHTGKGRHTTSHRELIVLENGGIMIDNPGMREVGMADASTGLEVTFEPIAELSEKCRYHDCTHTVESGCAILEALRDGLLSRESYDNYVKIGKEVVHFESTNAEKRKKEKNFGKMIREYEKSRKKNNL